MTREEIMRLEGRELDAAVAEHVLGWLGPVLWVEDEDGREPYMFAPTLECREAATRNDRAYDHIVDWYSSDIAAAWQVVERLTAMGYQFELSFVPRYEPEPWLALFFVPPRRPAPASSAFAATAAEAICRAALLAVCGEDDRDADA